MTTAWPTPHKDPGTPGTVPLDATPGRWFVTKAGIYAHLVRSAYTFQPRWAERPVISTELLCGGHGLDGFWLDEPGELVACGTCIGRSLGLDSTHPDIAFRPTKSLNLLQHRRWCPGPRRGLWLPLNGNRDGSCLLCGFVGQVRASRTAYSYGSVLQAHRPARPHAELFCPSCGWQHLSLIRRTVSCTRFGCTFTVPVQDPST